MYYESKDPRVHRTGIHASDGSGETLGLLTPVTEALFSNLNSIGLFEIFRSHGFEAQVLGRFMSVERMRGHRGVQREVGTTLSAMTRGRNAYRTVAMAVIGKGAPYCAE